ncbi:hypothetical protein CCACVL1_25605 [Corchorus capsularis]|uniref:Uncharacterized protein n=1 Tax=Corchorus capsularis TaxID=210143 RepID=A0A1R3GIW7_COCAP|nr:hypothetical protein CCACVL1_25605 [Corchorus capsularis]
MPWELGKDRSKSSGERQAGDFD